MEIERKYLLSKIPFDLSNYKKISIKQGYICADPVIRIRKSDDNHILTVKGGVKGADYPLERCEYEIFIDEKQFATLMKKVESKIISKSRYLIPIKSNLTAELDVYYGELEGLITVEVEFKNIDDAKSFIPPEWFGKDVTFDIRYSNNKLSKDGIPHD